jgi:hypothetical protein
MSVFPKNAMARFRKREEEEEEEEARPSLA